MEPELSAHCNLQKTHILDGHQFLCMFLAYDFRGYLTFSALHCMLTVVKFWRHEGY